MRHCGFGLAAAAICLLTFGCSNGATHAVKPSTTKKTPTSIAPPPLVDTSLPALMLSVDEANAVMGSNAMTITRTRFEMADDSATMQPKECLGIDGSAQAQVYAGSGFTAERDETMQEGDNFTHFVEQAVVLFPTAKQAEAFVGASAQNWGTCHQYTHVQSGSLWTVGPISNANGILSTTATQQNAKAPGWACGHALAARNNVVIDVNTCSANPADTAVNIANQVAARVQPQ